MFTHEISLRVRYAETDRMGYVYHGIYAQYFEVARVEALRSLGFSYKELEDDGVMLPVHDLQVKFHKPAFYDDQLRVTTSIVALPTVRMVFNYEVRNQANELLTEASTTLVFMDRAAGKPCRAPESVLAALRPYFS